MKSVQLPDRASERIACFVEGVPISNNQAEWDIRCLKTKQKVATNFQTCKGAKHYARIQSFISTIRKKSVNLLLDLINVLDRKSIVLQAGKFLKK